MPILLVQVSLDVVSLDAAVPDRDDSQVFDHLLRYCAKSDPLPAITITVIGERSTVGTSIYLRRGH